MSIDGELVTDADQKFPLRIVARLKNGILDDLAASLGGVKNLASEIGVTVETMSKWINLRSFPKFQGGKAKGPWRRDKAKRVIVKLCELSGKKIDEIFPGFARDLFKDIPRVVKIDRQLSSVQAAEALSRRDAQARLSGGDPGESAELNELKRSVINALRLLTERERSILETRFGLNGNQAMNLVETAIKFGVTKERIRQLEARALRKLEQPIRAAELIGHL